MMRSQRFRQALFSLLLASVLVVGLGFARQASTAYAVRFYQKRSPDDPPRLPAPTPEFNLPAPAVASEPSQDFSDLSIHFISRTPRYNRYCLEYERDVPELCPGSENDRHFPLPNEPVTFTARIFNQGSMTTSVVAYTWTLDGVVQHTGALESLEPGEETDLRWHWLWQTGVHRLGLNIEPDAEETIITNNSLEHRTDAHYLEILTHPYFVEAFAERRNLVGSYAFADWLQAQFAKMNQQLAGAVYPETPNGIADAIRIDEITVTEQVGGDIVSSTLAYDGRWTFRPETDYRNTPENEAWLSAQNYAQRFAGGIDWGLIHELTHQLGAIDLYQLNVSASAGNLVHDREGLPLLSGFQWPNPGLMGGGDVQTYSAQHYSDHTAIALTRNTGYRRGYFGEYLYDLPQTITLQVRDRSGQPVQNASVLAYQSLRNIVEEEPAFGGSTDAQGRFSLPRREVALSLSTATGHSLGPNPYGLINVTGRNGQLLLRIQVDDQEYFQWLPITDMNLAAWLGQNEVTVTVPTHFPSSQEGHNLASPQVNVRTQGSSVTLNWEPVSSASTYAIYRGLWPDYYPFKLVTSGITELSYSTVMTKTARFAVVAKGENGMASGFSNIARVELLYQPGGMVWQAESPYSVQGQLVVIDRHNGALLAALPPDQEQNHHMSWLGRLGSEHYGQVGAIAAAQSSDDSFGVALGSGQRVWIFDKSFEPLNWIGRVGDLPSPLDWPAGIALPGESFQIDLPLSRPDPAARLLLTFDGTLSDEAGTAPLLAEDVTFKPGRFDQAVTIAGNARLLYPAVDFPDERGGVEFWVRPQWPGDSKEDHVLLEIGDPNRDPEDHTTGYRLRLGYSEGGLYVWVTNFDDFDKAAWDEIAHWQPGEWHHVAATWDEQRLNLHVDGRLAWGEGLRVPIQGEPLAIAVGGTLQGKAVANADYDSLRISTFARLGNSDQVQVLVTERQLGEIKVLDLMGNPISTYVPDDDGLHEYGSLVATPDGRIWLADQHIRTVEELHLDGGKLYHQATLKMQILSSPQTLALSADGLLAVADGDRVLLLDPDRPEPPLAVWWGANDGSPGGFRQPVALAFGPKGELAVAEAGNRRVSFIDAPTSPHRQHLPWVIVGD